MLSSLTLNSISINDALVNRDDVFTPPLDREGLKGALSLHFVAGR